MGNGLERSRGGRGVEVTGKTVVRMEKYKKKHKVNIEELKQIYANIHIYAHSFILPCVFRIVSRS